MELDLLLKVRSLLDSCLNERALEVLNVYLSDHIDDCDAYYWRSICKNRLQDRSGAMNDLYKILEINPDNQQASAALELHHRILSFYSKDLLNP